MLKPSIFISYKRNDDPTLDAVTRIEAALLRQGFEVWRDINIEPGATWSAELYTWLMDCSGAVVIVGKAAAQSEWCRREWWFLRERNRTTGLPIIPISVDGSFESAGILGDFQGFPIGDAAIDELIARLGGLAAATPSAKNYLAAHHAWLRWQFNEAPLWGREPFSLRDIYVETDCGVMTWNEIAAGKEPRDPFKEENGGRHNLIQAVVDRLSNPAFRDLIVVQGPPGCGKSAFTLRLADELLQRGMHPVLARFRDFRLSTFDRADDLIEDALRIGPTQDEPPRPQQSLFEAGNLNTTTTLGKARVSELVFILDGWDEVSLTGSVSYQAQLQTWLPKIREFFVDRPGQSLRLILTGRPSAEVRGSGILKPNTPVLTIRPMTPGALKGFAGAMAARLKGRPESDPGYWQVDLKRLVPIFKRYDDWFRSDAAKKERSHSMEVVGSPLLAYLTFRTLADWQGDAEKLTDNPTALYKVLIDTTVEHAGKGRNEDVQRGVHRGGEPLRRLLHKVASVISTLGREAVSFTELDARLHDDPSFQEWSSRGGLRQAVDEATRRSVLHELVVNFYFKGGNTGIGCEFLHKSFREYLFAEAIVAVLKDQSEGKSGLLNHPAIDYWQDFSEGTSQYATSRALSRLLAPQWLSNEVRAHLQWLLADEIKRERDRWTWLRDLILDVYICWAEGVHLRPQPRVERGARRWKPAFVNDLVEDAMPFDPQAEAYPVRSTALDAHLGCALMQMTAIIHAELIETGREPDPQDSLRRHYRTVGEKVLFSPGGAYYFVELCARINAAGGWPTIAGRFSFPSGAVLPYVSLDGEQARDLNFSSSFFENASMRRAYLPLCQFIAARLTNVDLSEALLLNAFLSDVDLTGARMVKAMLDHATLTNARLLGADLSGASMTYANLTGADLRGATLASVSFQGADLTRTDLRGANLTSANLEGANLSNANLREARLGKTRLEGATLTGALLPETMSKAPPNAKQQANKRPVQKAAPKTSRSRRLPA